MLAAHGVSPVVRRQAAERGDLKVIDATCPLVAKVHTEARRYASQGYDLVLIGHADHEEVIGTLGEAPDRFHVVESVERRRAGSSSGASRSARVVYLTQTTLATDETAEIVAALRRRFPEIAAPPADDICYATQNRQDAVRLIAHRCDLMLVVGSANSSNTARLVEVARARRLPRRADRGRLAARARLARGREDASGSPPAPRRPTSWSKKCSTPSARSGRCA